MELTGHLADGRPVRVTVVGDRITGVEPVQRAPDDVLIAPGLLDLQVNGYAGLDVNAADVGASTVVELASALARRGVTGFCPTVITASPERIEHALRAVAAARAADPQTRHMVLGVHVEGPYLSPVDGARGAHDAAWLRDPDLAEFGRWADVAAGLVRIVTVAPECPGAAEYVAGVTARGVVAAIGHTGASAEQITACVAAGARLATHLGNGVAARLHRHHNPIWGQLADDRLAATFIADGHHLPAEVLVPMLRAKGPGRSILISDSAALAGSAPGRYATPVGGDVVVEPDGRLVLGDTGYLAGSGRALDECLAWVTSHTPLLLAEALPLATANPARLLGRTDRGGVVAGASADLTVHVRDGAGEWTLDTVLLAGRPVRAGAAVGVAP